MFLLEVLISSDDEDECSCVELLSLNAESSDFTHVWTVLTVQARHITGNDWSERMEC